MTKNPAPGTNSYFIGIIPPEKIKSEIQIFKRDIHENYGSQASLNSPPHITLHMPFDWKLKKEALLVEKLARFSKSVAPFSIQLNSFNCFEPKVIYVDVSQNEQLEASQKMLFRFCKKELNLFNAQYKDLPFHPHITIAFRDLKKPMFYEAWEEFKNKTYSGSFNLEHITLLKHTGKSWEEFKQFEIAK